MSGVVEEHRGVKDDVVARKEYRKLLQFGDEERMDVSRLAVQIYRANTDRNERSGKLRRTYLDQFRVYKRNIFKNTHNKQACINYFNFKANILSMYIGFELCATTLIAIFVAVLSYSLKQVIELEGHTNNCRMDCVRPSQSHWICPHTSDQTVLIQSGSSGLL